jgi:excisionase family DNA binding protein
MENAVIVSGNDLRSLIREAVRTELSILSRATPQAPNEPQEGGIDFAVEVLKVFARSTIYKMTSEGKIPYTKRGKTLWFNRAALEKWLADGATTQRR